MSYKENLPQQLHCKVPKPLSEGWIDYSYQSLLYHHTCHLGLRLALDLQLQFFFTFCCHSNNFLRYTDKGVLRVRKKSHVLQQSARSLTKLKRHEEPKLKTSYSNEKSNVRGKIIRPLVHFEIIHLLKADFLSWQKLLATIFFQKKSVK